MWKRLDYITNPTAYARAHTKCSPNTLRPHPRSPSLQLFATGAKLLQKGAEVKGFPCETSVSISSQFTGVSFSPWRYSTSKLLLPNTSIIRERVKKEHIANVKSSPHNLDTHFDLDQFIQTFFYLVIIKPWRCSSFSFICWCSQISVAIQIQ